MARTTPKIIIRPADTGETLKKKLLGAGYKVKPVPGDKTSFQVSNAATEKTFNRGAAKPWTPKGGRAPQKDLNVPAPKQAPTGRGPGYDGSKGYTKK